MWTGPESGINAVQVENIHFVIDLSLSPHPPLTSPVTHHTAKQACIMRVLRQHGIFSFLEKFRDLAILLYLGSRPKSLLDSAVGLWLQQEKMVRRVCHRITTEKVYTGRPLLRW